MKKSVVIAVAGIVLSALHVLAASPELLALRQQYEKSVNEKVDTPHEAALKQLNARYLEAVERSITTVRAAGDLTEVLALEAEKKLIAGGGVLPDGDDDAKASLKKLRVVYRDQLAKLNAQRTVNQAVVLNPHLAALKQLEITLTKANRVADAKEVMDYRISLGGDAGASSPSIFPQASFTNSLGMTFVPVKGTNVLFCIHETRRQDYAVFATETREADNDWKNFKVEGVAAGHEDDHPAVHVSWDNAKKFCEWLSKKEGKTYRLPTDKEWSYAVGNGNKERWVKSATPESLDGKEDSEYPWGKKYPPLDSEKAGNYGDKAYISKFPGNPFIETYSDGFISTAPVMSFKPNKLGLYDMGGNVNEWVEDWWNEAKVEHVLRGGGWNMGKSDVLLSSRRFRIADAGIQYYRSYGFRVVLEQP